MWIGPLLPFGIGHRLFRQEFAIEYDFIVSRNRYIDAIAWQQTLLKCRRIVFWGETSDGFAGFGGLVERGAHEARLGHPDASGDQEFVVQFVLRGGRRQRDRLQDVTLA